MAQRDGTSFETGHIEIKSIKVVAEGFWQLEPISRARDSLFIARQSAAEMRDHKRQFWIPFQHLAGNKPRHRHAEIEFPRENDRELIVFQQLIILGCKRGMDKDRNLQSRNSIVKGSELLRVQRHPAHLRRDRHPFQLKITDSSVELFHSQLALKRRYVGQADKASGIFFLNFRRAVVKQPTILQGRIPSQNTSLHGNMNARPIHILDLRVEIEELGMNVGLSNAVLLDDGSSFRVDPLASRQL